MIINTITCHDVYNVGASLQAYALATYLTGCKHDVRIIDYKPDYLSRHYSLTWVNNPRFDKPLLKQAFLLAKLPSRLKAKRSLRKQRFDCFREQYLPLTARYDSYEALRADPPPADVYIAGSDQIWNPLFRNGKDPAFFLQFAKDGTKRLAYAASFAVDELSVEDAARMTPWLREFDAIAVRERSGAAIVRSMGCQAQAVCDPVFLLDRSQWETIAAAPPKSDYILVYDFENNPALNAVAKAIAAKSGKPIVSVFDNSEADDVWADMGPREFVGAIQHAHTVVSNSFHATAFSLIFQKEFYVVERREGINARMRDLLDDVGLADRMIGEPMMTTPVDWQATENLLAAMTSRGKRYLQEQLKE